MNRTLLAVLPIGICLAVASLVVNTPAQSVRAEQASGNKVDAEPVEDDMHEFMEYLFQPTYKRLKLVMAAEPEGNSAWKAMKSDALILAEGGNLLLSRLPEEDANDWVKQSVEVRRQGGELYRAAKAKDFAVASQHYKSMLENCNACHKQFADGKHMLEP